MNPVRHRARRLACSAVYDGALTLKIDTTKAGSASDTFILSLGTGVNFDGIIAWGDGTTTRLTGAPGDVSHTYPVAGIYIVRCWEFKVGGFPRVYFNNAGDKAKVLEIMQWGQNEWSTMQNAWFGCANMIVTATDGPRARTAKVANCGATFRGCSILRPFVPFPTPNATDMSNFFHTCTLMTENRFKQLSKVTTLSSAYYASGLKSYDWVDTGAVATWTLAFYNCTGMAGYDFPTIDMHSITVGTNLFYAVTISKASYNSMLDQLAFGRGSIPAAAATGVAFYASAHYDASTGGYDGTAARAYLTGTKTWTITDAGTP
jgi:hypothetical protein